MHCSNTLSFKSHNLKRIYVWGLFKQAVKFTWSYFFVQLGFAAFDKGAQYVSGYKDAFLIGV